MFGDPPALVRAAVLCWFGTVVVWWMHFANGLAWTSTLRSDLPIDFSGTSYGLIASAAVVALALAVRVGWGWARYVLAAGGALFTLAWVLPALIAVAAAAADGAPTGLVLTTAALRLALLLLIVTGAALLFTSRASWYFT